MLKRYKPLKRTPLKRKPCKIKKVSDKRRVENQEYLKKREQFLKENPVCEAKWDCHGADSTDVHHIEGREGENFLKVSTWLSVCRDCHRKIELNPKEAKERCFSRTRNGRRGIFDKKSIMATDNRNLEETYQAVTLTEGDPASGPGNEGSAAPANYKPLGTDQRQQWNNFIRWLNAEKKVGGSAELDKRDRSRGLEYMEEYRKSHPEFKVTADQVPSVQWEIQQLKGMGSLPDQQNLNPNVQSIVTGYYEDRPVSNVDGWLGSLTSRQAYPEVQEFDDDKDKRKWGLDYTGASNYANSSKRWSRPAGPARRISGTPMAGAPPSSN